MKRAFVLIATAAVVACAGNGSSTTQPTDTTEDLGIVELRTEVLNDLSEEVIGPGYARMAAATEDLIATISELCASPDPELLTVARDAWLQAEKAWMAVQAYKFGPLRDRRLDNAVAYPVDPAKVEAEADAGTTDIGSLGSDARGLNAIEVVLFGPGSEALAVNSANRCAYGNAVASAVGEAAGTASEAWNQTPWTDLATSYPTTQEGVEMAINDLITSVGDAAGFLSALASGEPVDGPAGQGLADVASRMEGVEAMYSGGLNALVQTAFAPTDERMRERLKAALQTIEALPAEPSAEELNVAYEAVAAVHRTLTTEIASQLGATLMLGDADGDS